MKTYRTSQVASAIGIHPNTVRLYETLGLISPPHRQPNGYRVYTEQHLAQFRLARTAFQIEVLQNGLRKKMIAAIKASAAGEIDQALSLTQAYLSQIEEEKKNAEEAEHLVMQLLQGHAPHLEAALRRKEASALLNISMDCLRNWEMNGLLHIKRKENGYRVYLGEDILRLKIIRVLRSGGYSLEAILRMLRALSENPNADIRHALNTPPADAEIIAVCDKLIESLCAARQNAVCMMDMLKTMKENFYNPPF